jgi:hypothetical protein
VPFFAKAGVNGVPSSSQALWPSIEVVRLTALHAREASAAATKGGASPTPTTAAPVESGTGQDGGAPQNSAGDVGQPREAARTAPTSEKSLIASTGPSQGNGATGMTGSAASALGTSVAESSTKAPPTGSPNLGTSAAAATMKSAAMVLSLDAAPVTAAQVVSEVAKSQGVLSPLQSLASLSTKTGSPFPHSIVGDTSFVGAVEGTTGSSTGQDLLTSDGASAAKPAQNLSVTEVAMVTATAGSTATAPVATTKTAVGTPAPSASGDHTAADAIGSQAVPIAQTTPADPPHGATAANSTSLPALASNSGSQAGAAAPVKEAQVGTTDQSHPPPASGGTVVATPGSAVTVPATSTTPSAEKAGADVKGADGLSSADAGVQTEAQQVVALQAVSALVSPTNTVTKAVSISLVTSTTMLDATQLKLIDAFMNSTPNVKIVATGTTLEIYDPSALSDPDIHAISWDLGGGSTIKVVGIADAHPL